GVDDPGDDSSRGECEPEPAPRAADGISPFRAAVGDWTDDGGSGSRRTPRWTWAATAISARPPTTLSGRKGHDAGTRDEPCRRSARSRSANDVARFIPAYEP